MSLSLSFILPFDLFSIFDIIGYLDIYVEWKKNELKDMWLPIGYLKIIFFYSFWLIISYSNWKWVKKRCDYPLDISE